jgi:hypothetical protein
MYVYRLCPGLSLTCIYIGQLILCGNGVQCLSLLNSNDLIAQRSGYSRIVVFLQRRLSYEFAPFDNS